MPKIAKELTAKAVEQLKNDGRHAVGGVRGLHLRILGNSKSWILRTLIRAQVEGESTVNRRDIGLGSYPLVSLAEARESARKELRKIRDGVDPVLERRMQKQSAKRARSFEEAALTYIDVQSQGWKNKKHIQQWRNTLKQYAFPYIGKLSPVDIGTADVLSVLQQKVDGKIFWFEKTETASRVRLRIERVLAAEVEFPNSRNKTNPATAENIKKHLPPAARTKKSSHFEALPYRQVGEFMTSLRSRKGFAARAVEFLIYTAARSGEVRGMTWSEVDVAQKLWVVPDERMKAGRAHSVPLSNEAIQLLNALPRYEESNLVFPSPKGVKLSDMGLTAVLRRMEYKPITVHGFRSSFRDWAAEQTSHPRQAIEFAIAHKLKDQTEAAYFRSNLLDKRRVLMQDWSHYCTKIQSTSSNVVELDRAPEEVKNA